jgi:prepilin-type N-terminal cleavage/methylation domain-containing protein
MKKLPHSVSAFTLIELLVVISIIAILASLSIPAVTGALARGQMTQTLNNARQLHLQTQTMTIDTTTSGFGWSWTYDGTNAGSLSGFCTALMSNNYLTANELRKIFTAPGVTPPAGDSVFTAGNVAFKVMQTKDSDPSENVFVITKNWSSGGLQGETQPYGNKGFVLMRKGGDGAVFTRATDATSSNVIGTNISQLIPLQ